MPGWFPVRIMSLSELGSLIGLANLLGAWRCLVVVSLVSSPCPVPGWDRMPDLQLVSRRSSTCNYCLLDPSLRYTLLVAETFSS